jgi:hypothetical protein
MTALLAKGCLEGTAGTRRALFRKNQAELYCGKRSGRRVRRAILQGR